MTFKDILVGVVTATLLAVLAYLHIKHDFLSEEEGQQAIFLILFSVIALIPAAIFWEGRCSLMRKQEEP